MKGDCFREIVSKQPTIKSIRLKGKIVSHLEQRDMSTNVYNCENNGSNDILLIRNVNPFRHK